MSLTVSSAIIIIVILVLLFFFAMEAVLHALVLVVVLLRVVGCQTHECNSSKNCIGFYEVQTNERA